MRGKGNKSIVEGLGNLIKRKFIADKKISVEFLIPGKTAILKLVYTRIKPCKSNPLPKKTDVISCLVALQKKFVLVPIDKVYKNFAIM